MAVMVWRTPPDAPDLSRASGVYCGRGYRATVCPVAEGAVWWIQVRRPAYSHRSPSPRFGVVLSGRAGSTASAMDEATQVILWLCWGTALRIRVGGVYLSCRGAARAAQ